MKRIVRWVLVLAAVMTAMGCMGTKETGVTPKTFGVLNSFPEHPLYLKKQTLVARHQRNEIQALSLKSQFTEAVVQYLTDKGYRAVPVADKSALKAGQVDMLVEIVPRQVNKMDGMTAYGFSDRNFLLGLVKQHARSYVALHLELSRKNSARVVKTSREERFSALGMDMMPESWDGLTQEEKAAFEQNLRDNIAKAVYLSLSQLKI